MKSCRRDAQDWLMLKAGLVLSCAQQGPETPREGQHVNPIATHSFCTPQVQHEGQPRAAVTSKWSQRRVRSRAPLTQKITPTSHHTAQCHTNRHTTGQSQHLATTHCIQLSPTKPQQNAPGGCRTSGPPTQGDLRGATSITHTYTTPHLDCTTPHHKPLHTIMRCCTPPQMTTQHPSPHTTVPNPETTHRTDQ